jgi:hypothetical protein
VDNPEKYLEEKKNETVTAQEPVTEKTAPGITTALKLSDN